MKEENLHANLLSVIKDYLKTLNLDNQALPELYLEFPSQKEYGDLSISVALKLGKILKSPPRTIAESILIYLNQQIKGTNLRQDIASIQIVGAGFINFFLSDNYFHKVLKGILDSGNNFGRGILGSKQNVLVEFVSANPTGPLSVAHARQGAVGDALCNILEFLGFKLKREYYLNDEGNQIRLLGKSIEARLCELTGKSCEFPEGGYEGEYIRQIANLILEKPPFFLKGSSDAPEGMQDGDKKRLDFFSDYGTSHILNVIKQELNDFGIKFDSWYSQEKLTKSGKIQKALEWLKEKGLIYEKDGASWFKSTAFGDDKDRVVIKNDGSYTYLAPDIAYHDHKYKRGFNWLINLWGPDHHGYIGRIKAAIQALGKDSGSLSIVIVQLATIFRDGEALPMSTRKGRYITLREILDEVGPDTSRFFFLMRRTSAHLDFDLELAKKQTPENPVYYVQYAHARICSIIRNAQGNYSVGNADLSLLKEPEELGLLKVLWQFPYTIEACYKNIDPYFITIYLQEVAEKLHKFYDRYRVLGD
ncbi:MAG: arginine--tRNA ligase, partial [Candidatus Omnitrophota bacterium]